MGDRVRILAKGPLGTGTEVRIVDPQTGELREAQLEVRRIEVDPITPDGLLVARLEVLVDELDITAEVLPRVEPQVVQLQPGDVLVCRLPDGTAPVQRGRIMSELSRRFPFNEVILLDQGVGLQVFRRDTDAADAARRRLGEVLAHGAPALAPSLPAADERCPACGGTRSGPHTVPHGVQEFPWCRSAFHDAARSKPAGGEVAGG